MCHEGKIAFTVQLCVLMHVSCFGAALSCSRLTSWVFRRQKVPWKVVASSYPEFMSKMHAAFTLEAFIAIVLNLLPHYKSTLRKDLRVTELTFICAIQVFDRFWQTCLPVMYYWCFFSIAASVDSVCWGCEFFILNVSLLWIVLDGAGGRRIRISTDRKAMESGGSDWRLEFCPGNFINVGTTVLRFAWLMTSTR